MYIYLYISQESSLLRAKQVLIRQPFFIEEVLPLNDNRWPSPGPSLTVPHPSCSGGLKDKHSAAGGASQGWSREGESPPLTF